MTDPPTDPAALRAAALPGSDPTAGLMLHVLAAFSGAETLIRFGPTTIAGIYTGSASAARWPSRETPRGTQLTLTVYVPDCSCEGIDDYDPDCWRHGTREPEDDEVARLLPGAVEAMGYAVGRYTDLAKTLEEERVANALAAALREQTRPSATPADGSGQPWGGTATMPVDPAVRRREMSLISQGMIDAAELLRCGGYDRAEVAEAIEAIEKEAERVRTLPAETTTGRPGGGSP